MEKVFDRKKKYYCFAFVLYKDSTTYSYDNIIDYIRHNWTNYGYIEHSPEVDEHKNHTHVLVQFPNKRYISAISKEIGLEDNYITPVHFIPYLRYLIHYDDEEKKQYNPHEVFGPLQYKLLSLIKNSTNEEESAQQIFNYIVSYPTQLTLQELCNYIFINGFYSSFRRNYTFFKDLLVDHNKNYVLLLK